MKSNPLQPSSFNPYNPYIQLLEEKYAPWFFNEKKAVLYKGLWRKEVFNDSSSDSSSNSPFNPHPFTPSLVKTPLDLEIGIGIGNHFAHRAKLYPHRYIIGIDLRFKRLTQALRRSMKSKANNMRILRCNGKALKKFFSKGELSQIFIHFPDPWEKRRQKKQRLIQKEFVEDLYFLQGKGEEVELKTDSLNYFEEALNLFKKTSYVLKTVSYNLHQNLKENLDQNLNGSVKENLFLTPFEKIFLKQNKAIYFAQLLKS